EMKNRFGVAVGSVDVSVSFERFAVVGVVVNLAVVGNVQGRVFGVGHRLMTRRDIDDAQTPVAQADVAIDKETFFVRTTMRDDVAHRLQQRLRNQPTRLARKSYPVNSAHIFLPSTDLTQRHSSPRIITRS